jgi:hypothetical protein
MFCLIYLKQLVLSYQFVEAKFELSCNFIHDQIHNIHGYLLSYFAIFLGTSGGWVQTQSNYVMSVGWPMN